jgi:glycosyltransferase involved in cell wall biosynthesis
MNRRLRIGCCAELSDPGWRWVADALPPDGPDWTFFSTAPARRIEQMVQRPRLSRYRACRELAAAACRGDFDLVITHHPLVTCWTEAFCRRRRSCPHVAFAFNFTQLPSGPRLAMMRRAYVTIDRFVVFSRWERELYSRVFGIELSRFDMVHWGVREPDCLRAPASDLTSEASTQTPICAVGTQGRDYATLLEAMRGLPHIPLTLVAGRQNVTGLHIGPNVELRIGIPRAEAEDVIRRSRFLVLPLVDADVPCGHVTIVTAMFLGKAIIATNSAGISDYVIPGTSGIVVPPKNPEALAAAIDRLWNEPQTAQWFGSQGRQFALANCTEERTVAYVRELIDRVTDQGKSQK